MEKIRYSYDQNNDLKDIDKLLKHVENLGYKIINWHTCGGELYVEADKKEKK